jgi:hypothetical protein
MAGLDPAILFVPAATTDTHNARARGWHRIKSHQDDLAGDFAPFQLAAQETP